MPSWKESACTAKWMQPPRQCFRPPQPLHRPSRMLKACRCRSWLSVKVTALLDGTRLSLSPKRPNLAKSPVLKASPMAAAPSNSMCRDSPCLPPGAAWKYSEGGTEHPMSMTCSIIANFILPVTGAKTEASSSAGMCLEASTRIPSTPMSDSLCTKPVSVFCTDFEPVSRSGSPSRSHSWMTLRLRLLNPQFLLVSPGLWWKSSGA
mmetsp:Transcript_10929/g.22283  ORF Transcript_10929/g.22283 Transcript_10929/m.22283 type:complete len:206 (+) Transcript_10929:904-1521(+)